MEKGTDSKRVNEDFIPVVHLNGSRLEYTDIIIENKYEYLISLIKKALANDSHLLIEIQNTFSYIFTGKPRGYSFCLPYNYSDAFVDSAEYPKIYSQEEYDSEINHVRTDYIKKENEELDKKKEEGKIDDRYYQEAIERVKQEAEERVNDHITEIRDSFVNKSVRYIRAFEFYKALEKIKADETNVMYSTELIGWTKFNYSIKKNVVVYFKSNFCYGRSAYFHITLIYKGVELLSYPKLVQYYYANMLDFIDCTESYKPERYNWKPALSFIVDQANWATEDEDAFVQKWIIDGTNEMVFGLGVILNDPSTVIDKLIKSDIDDSSLYAVRNITKDEIAEYKVYRHEMTIAFQAEKISGSLLLIPNLTKLCSLYPQIKSIIHEIERINRAFFPRLHNAIETLSYKIKSLSNKVDSIQTEFHTFIRNNFQQFRDYDMFKDRNRDSINVFGYYIKAHPDFEMLFNKRNEYKEEIDELTNELKRFTKFKTQLSRCAQLICDYGLASSDDYLSTVVSKGQELLSVSEESFKMSKDKKRLFKYINSLQTKCVALPYTIKVICDSVFSNNNIIETIKFPAQLKKIGSCGFQSCYNLQEIVLPNSVEEMGTDNFFACRSLKRVVLSSSMKEIPSWSFYNCTSLNQIVIPTSIKKIGNGAFRGCSSLISINLPPSIEEVGENIFEGCGNLRKICVPTSSIAKFAIILGQYKKKLVGVN